MKQKYLDEARAYVERFRKCKNKSEEEQVLIELTTEDLAILEALLTNSTLVKE